MAEYIVNTEDFDSHDTLVGYIKYNYNELIRCKDCEHYWELAKMCTNTGNPLSDYCEPIDFCSKAERKEE